MWEFCVRRVLHLLSASLFTSCVAGSGAPPPTVIGARGHSVSFPPGIPVGPDVAEVEWSRTSPRTRIVKYSKGHIEYFGSEEYKRQVTLHPGDFSLEIRDLRREDAGEYEVNVAASSGAETLGTVRLEVYEPVSGTHITVQNITGTCNLTLTCSLTSGDPTSFRWWRGREAVGNDTTHHLWEHGETVEIHHTAEVEDVVYSCEARNPVSEGTAQIRLGENCKQTQSAGTGASPLTVIGTVGHSVSLHPLVRLGWNNDAVWKKAPNVVIAKSSDGNIKYYGPEEYKRQITLHPRNYSLEIRDLRREDAGDYELTVTNEFGADTKWKVRLDVYEPVSGTHITVQNITGTCNLTLTCSVTSGNPTSFRWWRGGEAVGNDSPYHLWEHGETVEIHHTAEVEDVVYRCEARNPVSEGTAQIRLWDVCNLDTPDAA